MSSKPIRDLAALLRALPQLQLRQGVVDANNGDGTLDVTIAGDDETTPDVQRLAGTTVTVGQTVWLLQVGPLYLALGGSATT